MSDADRGKQHWHCKVCGWLFLVKPDPRRHCNICGTSMQFDEWGVCTQFCPCRPAEVKT
jgi:rubrerythrin